MIAQSLVKTRRPPWLGLKYATDPNGIWQIFQVLHAFSPSSYIRSSGSKGVTTPLLIIRPSVVNLRS